MARGRFCSGGTGGAVNPVNPVAFGEPPPPRSQFEREVLALENTILLAVAVVETAHDMVAVAVHVYAVPARRVVESFGLRLLARHGGHMADEVAALAEILPAVRQCGSRTPQPAEVAALVALTHAAVAVESIAAGESRHHAFALRFFEAAARVHALHAPAGSESDAQMCSRARVLLRINP